LILPVFTIQILSAGTPELDVVWLKILQAVAGDNKQALVRL
jgi:hypothetical protein